MPTSTFAQKCHEMVSAGHSTIGWTREGDKVWVSNPEKLAREHIPQYYDHSSYASWTRALHAHSFRKLTPSTWSHPSFHRDRPRDASTIVRKRPPHRGGKPAREEKPFLKVEARPARAKRNQKQPNEKELREKELKEKKLKEKENELEQLPPLRPCRIDRSTNEKKADASASSDAGERDAGSKEESRKSGPSPEQAARLAALREQILREKKVAKQLRTMLEQLEANATRARREELQLRHTVVQLAEWIATTAIAPAVACTALATAGGLATSAASMAAAVAAKALSSLPPPRSATTSCSVEAKVENIADSPLSPKDPLASTQMLVAAA